VRRGKFQHFVLTQAEEKADPSSSLRFGRDDTFHVTNFRPGRRDIDEVGAGGRASVNKKIFQGTSLWPLTFYA
jgi:hypothetical protein